MLQNKRSANTVSVMFALCITSLIAGCAGASFSLGPLSIDASRPRAGTLLYADPGVTVTRSGQGVIRYEPGMEVLTGDSIETADGQAVIDYDDGSAVILNRATHLQLGSIRLFFGELFARVKSIATRGGGQVVTNELSASVEGTEYGVRRDLPAADAASGHVQVYVRDGHVRCTPSARASWSPVTLTENLLLDVTGYRAAPKVRTADARSLSRWADDAERRLRKARSPEIRPGIMVPIGPRPAREKPREKPASYESSE
ncbi:MAG: FecR domain-containing protein [Dechloromonas sp.]|nr:FecR domain-containing protein [Dechloromonas sp.]